MDARIASVASGGDDYLTKAVNPALLLSAVAARVERARFVLDGLDRDDAVRLMERIVEEFAATDHDVGDGRTFRSSFSAGIVMLRSDCADVASWIRQADEALYAAKNAGRHCVQVSESAGATEEPAEESS